MTDSSASGKVAGGGDSTTPEGEQVEVLWTPAPDAVAHTRIARFRSWLAAERGVELADYAALWQWSVDELEKFWAAVAEFLDVRFHAQPETVLAERVMPGARWFPGATLNYAEQALLVGNGKDDAAEAVFFQREDGHTESLTYGELRDRVAAARAAFAAIGVTQGDRVAALVRNTPDTLVAFLAAASLGATWSSCSPDFGVRAVLDRFTQIEPTVLVAVDGYHYDGRRSTSAPPSTAPRRGPRPARRRPAALPGPRRRPCRPARRYRPCAGTTCSPSTRVPR